MSTIDNKQGVSTQIVNFECQLLTIRDVSEAGCEAADYAGNAEFCLLWRKAKTT